MWKILTLHIQIILMVLGFLSTLPSGKTDKIIRLKDAGITDYPYLVSIIVTVGYEYYETCGGTILNEYHILTAAYCTYHVTADSIVVRVGSSLTKGGAEHPVEIIHTPSCYNSFTLFCDISILKLSTPIANNSEAQPIKLATADSEIVDSQNAVTLGWSYTSADKTIADQIQIVTLPIISTEKCNDLYPKKISENAFCAGNNEDAAYVCEGDPGGPLVVDGVQIGITSELVHGCLHPPNKKSIVVFTNVAKFRDFIDEILKL